MKLARGPGLLLTIALSAVMMLMAVSGCSDALSGADVAKLKNEAEVFADAFFDEFGNPQCTFPWLAEDAVFYDPSDGDWTNRGKDRIVYLFHRFFSAFPELAAHPQGMFLSADGVALPEALEGLWPRQPEPPDHPPVEDMHIVHLKDGLVTNLDVWFSPATLEMVELAAFGPGQNGLEMCQQIVDRYVGAWTSGDEGQVAALYRDDAVFLDSVLGTRAEGPASIAELAEERFGPGKNETVEVVDLYVQTNGSNRPTATRPENGTIIAVGIHYCWTAVIDGVSRSLEGLTTFELGTRQLQSFDFDPNGLIVLDEFFYDPDSLLASGLLR